MAEAPCGGLDGCDQRRGDALAASLGRHEYAGEPRISRIALEIVEQKRSCADQRAGVVESDEYDRYAIDGQTLADLGGPRLQRLPGIEMPPLGEAPGRDLVDELGVFDEGDDLQRYSAALRFTAAERPRSVAIS